MILTTIPTLYYLVKARQTARLARGQLRWQGILTVVLTATIFFISTAPFILLYGLERLGGMGFVGTCAILKRAARFLKALNIMCNFYVYCLTVISFRQFIKSKLKTSAGLLRAILLRFSSNSNEEAMAGATEGAVEEAIELASTEDLGMDLVMKNCVETELETALRLPERLECSVEDSMGSFKELGIEANVEGEVEILGKTVMVNTDTIGIQDRK